MKLKSKTNLIRKIEKNNMFVYFELTQKEMS